LNIRGIGFVGNNSARLLSSLFLLTMLALYMLSFVPHAAAQAASGPVIIVGFSDPVDPGSSALMAQAVNYATGQQASAIIIDMNTPGGLLSDMTSIISSINEAEQAGIHTYTFVESNGLAASAGSYIAMATEKIIMAPGSAIGPSTPIVVGGSSLEQSHTQAAMLSLMLSLANKWGRNSTAAYYMVQSDEAFSVTQALDNHIADGQASSLADAIQTLGLSERRQFSISEDVYEQFLSALSNPILDGILILLGVVAIVLDIYHPTILLTIVGIVAIVAGLIGAEVIGASLLGFVIIAIAAVLIILELKIGHGFAIMAGVVLGAFGILYLAQGLGYSPSPITSATDLELFFVVVVGMLAGLYFRWVIGPIRRHAKLTGPEALVEQVGVAVTDLKPHGEVRVGGLIWKAESVSGDILKGESVRVKSIKGLAVVVEKSDGMVSEAKTDKS
jgi:membrane-bound serine protease (ClpP class)